MNLYLCGFQLKFYLFSPPDPRLKVFGNQKVNELRAWFDNRLEEAIKAAEDEKNSLNSPKGKKE